MSAATPARPVPSARRLGWLAMAGVLVVALLIGVTQGRGSTSPRDRARPAATRGA